eukprot:1796133-Alexandrium_andersonii.AAC.1
MAVRGTATCPMIARATLRHEPPIALLWRPGPRATWSSCRGRRGRGGAHPIILRREEVGGWRRNKGVRRGAGGAIGTLPTS